MMGCSKHEAPVSDCTACTRVAHAREQLELASSAGETFHVEEIRPRHLAVLTVLVLSNQPVSRVSPSA